MVYSKDRGFRKKERAEFNQYWYSPETIEAICSELGNISGPIAFLSTPSLFFAANLPNSVLFDFDEALGKDLEAARFVHFDFREISTIPKNFHSHFAAVVADPPFITADVWRLYAAAARLLGGEAALFLGTTVQENSDLMRELFRASETPFKPSIPSLVYQYSLFTNFVVAGLLARPNPEISLDSLNFVFQSFGFLFLSLLDVYY
jgi:hypothetical protein